MKKIVFTLLILLFFNKSPEAQMLSGKVKAESGLAASGVTVEFLNKANKITTNPEGGFKIFAPNLPDTLILSAPGFEPYKVIITEKNIKDPNFEVVLLSKRDKLHFKDVAMSTEVSSMRMDEVVVTGMSTRKSKEFAGYSGRTRAISGDGEGNKRKLYSRDSIKASVSLTAGEINDFNKWKMWEDLTSKEFQIFSSHWELVPKQRYSVQLVDPAHRPIPNEIVYLINNVTADTVWQTVTDNTGKAELWAEMQTGERNGNYKIVSANGAIDRKASAFENGMNILTLNKACSENNDVDISFVVDATGSMGDEIEFLKLELEQVLQTTADKYGKLNLRYSSVFYRDHDDEYVTRHLDFQQDMLKVLNFIKLQQSGGGGDFPEAVDEALEVALTKLSWSKEARAKIIFLLLDAPPHETAKPRMLAMIRKAAAMGIRIVPIACSGTDKSTEYLLRSVALATNGTYGFLTNHSGIGNSHIEPSTDSYKVELLSSLMQRILEQYLFTTPCNKTDLSQAPVAATDLTETKLKIFPNPTRGNFTIKTNLKINEMYITDFTGKFLMKVAVNKNGLWRVDITNYPSGTYLIKYITDDNKIGNERVVLMH